MNKNAQIEKEYEQQIIWDKLKYKGGPELSGSVHHFKGDGKSASFMVSHDKMGAGTGRFDVLMNGIRLSKSEYDIWNFGSSSDVYFIDPPANGSLITLNIYIKG